MYSGSTLTRYSGRVLGAHQKVDKVARKHLHFITDGAVGFPAVKSILHFEGKNGPDAIKRKSPAKDEPWHWYDPYDEDDSNLLILIEEHYTQLISELIYMNMERAAFEAAWLAHALVDGLTPAHHYPFEERLSELRGGEGNETRTSVYKKIVMPGETLGMMFSNNWKMWGPKGLFATHGMFELGVATIMAPLRLHSARPSPQDITHLHQIGPLELFKHSARRIANLNIYERFYDKGWTPSLADLIRDELAPEATKTVCLFWYSALQEARISNVEANA